MRLSALLAALPAPLAPTAWQRADAAADPIVRGLAYDSRRVCPGDLFVALRGAVTDGHDYLAQARALGAVAFVVETAPANDVAGDLPVVVVPDARRALAPLAARFYGDPASELRLVGVTGTNGKTSTTYLVESILQRAGARTGLIGTVEIRYAGERQPAVNTTPESLDLQRLLRSMVTLGVEAAVMEVSSHGLELGRVAGCHFAVGAFTNLTQDHLDFHGSMEAYLASKARLFRDHLAPGGAAVVNVDDPAGARLVAIARERGAEVWRCSRRAGATRDEAELRVLSARTSLDGTQARLAWPDGAEQDVALPLIGDFNVENLLVACGIAGALGLPRDAIAEGVARCPQVPGRVERVRPSAADALAPGVLVDYAHTPDAVEKLLASVRPLAQGTGRLIAVFGCGGDRDRRKRPLMAEAVARRADVAIATSDNPRTEDPDAILRDVEEGLRSLARVEPEALGPASGCYAIVRDRREAIERAIAIAGDEDTVVLAGKGHEDYQIVGREKLPFDDRQEARRALDRRVAPRTGGDAPRGGAR